MADNNVDFNINSDDEATDNNDKNTNNGRVTWTNRLADELHKPIRKKFRKRRVIMTSVDQI